MTYLAKSNKFKISCFSLKLQDSNNYQLISSATYENISLISDNTYNTIIDNFNELISQLSKEIQDKEGRTRSRTVDEEIRFNYLAPIK